MATEPGHRFELALALGELQRARQLAGELAAAEGGAGGAAAARWARLGGAALAAADVALATDCFRSAQDYSSLLLLALSTGSRALAGEVAAAAAAAGADNVAFAAHFALHGYARCLDLLLSAERHAEAAFFAR